MLADCSLEMGVNVGEDWYCDWSLRGWCYDDGDVSFGVTLKWRVCMPCASSTWRVRWTV